ncbi:MAG: hypothetical protein ACYCXN_11950 [Acidimicrobiales bacterium]
MPSRARSTPTPFNMLRKKLALAGAKRRAGIMFKTAWRAGPGPRSVMRFCFARHLVFRARYPLGIRAVVNGATGHDQATVIAGVVVVVVALSVPASWALPIIRASLNSRRTDQGNLALFFPVGQARHSRSISRGPWRVASCEKAPLVVVLDR